jgi:hypothetical protein
MTMTMKQPLLKTASLAVAVQACNLCIPTLAEELDMLSGVNREQTIRGGLDRLASFH